ncbi:hypothetical protein [Alteromonas sp. BMJM2]|uniref:hypothetical protein n=1 Tax=Alteromonas sp. BMJM2 TaxID=2954241 RepID=UPI0022B2FEF6|nr:hypothetical protein [Alteromonas sp. BMJM2]
MKNTTLILLIVGFFGLIKLNAPQLVKFMPDWVNALIFFVVFFGLVFQFGKFIFKHRRKDE